MSLVDAFEPLSWDVAFWMASVTEPATPVDELGQLCLELEEKLRALAIIALLTNADVDTFLHNLIRAGSFWARFLERCRNEGATNDHNFCAGLCEPLLNAVAAREFTLASRLAKQAPDYFREGHEHESDFYYARALHGLLVGAPAESELTDLLDRCAEAGDEMSGARADVCRGLQAHDQGAFDAGFRWLLDTRKAQISTDEERGQLVTAPIEACRKVFVEGIALLNLAERSGLAVDPDYPMCPSLARQPMRKPYPGPW